MKKLSLLMMLLALSLIFQGCQILIIEENTDEYIQLSDQYNDYITNDITEFDGFKEFMNEASDVAVTSVFMIQADILDDLDRVKTTMYGTGTLILEDIDYLYILTTYQMIDFGNDDVNHYITDAYGEKVTAQIYAFDSVLNLGILKINNNSDNHYNIVDFASHLPLSDELVLMVSNNFPKQNIQKLGNFLYQDEISYMEVLSSQNANGSPVFNLKLEVIGVQYSYGDTHVQIIDFNTIDDFISELSSI